MSATRRTKKLMVCTFWEIQLIITATYSVMETKIRRNKNEFENCAPPISNSCWLFNPRWHADWKISTKEERNGKKFDPGNVPTSKAVMNGIKPMTISRPKQLPQRIEHPRLHCSSSHLCIENDVEDEWEEEEEEEEEEDEEEGGR